MTNKEKAREIANDDVLYGEDPDNNSKTDECYIAALEMAQWKDEQLESKLMQIIILAQQGYTSGATDEMILKHCKEIINEKHEHDNTKTYYR